MIDMYYCVNRDVEGIVSDFLKTASTGRCQSRVRSEDGTGLVLAYYHTCSPLTVISGGRE